MLVGRFLARTTQLVNPVLQVKDTAVYALLDLLVKTVHMVGNKYLHSVSFVL